MKISRLKTFCLTILFLIVSTVGMADLAFSYPLSQQPLILAQTPATPPEPTVNPALKQATESSIPPARKETSSSPSQPASGNQPATTSQQEKTSPTKEKSQPSKPSNTDTFGAFDRALYGS
jgi:hypothetical protein